MFVFTDKLNPEQLAALDALTAACHKHDAGLPSIYRHLLGEPRQPHSTLLYYHNSVLVGFLSVYFFYEDACEMALLVHPAHRHQTIATQLLQQAIPYLDTAAIQHVLFSAPPAFIPPLQSGLTALPSEYTMERINLLPATINLPRLTITPATGNDASILAHIDAACFPSTQPNPPSRFTELINNPNYRLLMAYHANKPIGKAHLRWESQDRVSLLDIAILPAFQKQGFGSELIAYAINEALSRGATQLALSVSCENSSNALGLYLHHGFAIQWQCNYWTISLDALRQWLVR